MGVFPMKTRLTATTMLVISLLVGCKSETPPPAGVSGRVQAPAGASAAGLMVTLKAANGIETTVFTGTELKAPPSPKPPHVSVIGNLSLAAIALQRVLKRRVVVPPALRGVSVKKSFKGTARSVAAQLGLEVTTKRA